MVITKADVTQDVLEEVVALFDAISVVNLTPLLKYNTVLITASGGGDNSGVEECNVRYVDWRRLLTGDYEEEDYEFQIQCLLLGLLVEANYLLYKRSIYDNGAVLPIFDTLADSEVCIVRKGKVFTNSDPTETRDFIVEILDASKIEAVNKDQIKDDEREACAILVAKLLNALLAEPDTDYIQLENSSLMYALENVLDNTLDIDSPDIIHQYATGTPMSAAINESSRVESIPIDYFLSHLQDMVLWHVTHSDIFDNWEYGSGSAIKCVNILDLGVLLLFSGYCLEEPEEELVGTEEDAYHEDYELEYDEIQVCYVRGYDTYTDKRRLSVRPPYVRKILEGITGDEVGTLTIHPGVLNTVIIYGYLRDKSSELSYEKITSKIGRICAGDYSELTDAINSYYLPETYKLLRNENNYTVIDDHNTSTEVVIVPISTQWRTVSSFSETTRNIWAMSSNLLLYMEDRYRSTTNNTEKEIFPFSGGYEKDLNALTRTCKLILTSRDDNQIDKYAGRNSPHEIKLSKLSPMLLRLHSDYKSINMLPLVYQDASYTLFPEEREASNCLIATVGKESVFDLLPNNYVAHAPGNTSTRNYISSSESTAQSLIRCVCSCVSSPSFLLESFWDFLLELEKKRVWESERQSRHNLLGYYASYVLRPLLADRITGYFDQLPAVSDKLFLRVHDFYFPNEGANYYRRYEELAKLLKAPSTESVMAAVLILEIINTSIRRVGKTRTMSTGCFPEVKVNTALAVSSLGCILDLRNNTARTFVDEVRNRESVKNVHSSNVWVYPRSSTGHILSTILNNSRDIKILANYLTNIGVVEAVLAV